VYPGGYYGYFVQPGGSQSSGTSGTATGGGVFPSGTEAPMGAQFIITDSLGRSASAFVVAGGECP
jgi:hypothetical protein